MRHGRSTCWQYLEPHELTEKSKDEWTKAAMIEEIRDVCVRSEYDFERIEPLVQRLREDEVFKGFFRPSSWFRFETRGVETGFYKVDPVSVARYAEGEREVFIPVAPDPVKGKVYVRYMTWEGRSKREHEEYGIKMGQWIWLLGGRRLHADSPWVFLIEHLWRAPYGKAWIFRHVAIDRRITLRRRKESAKLRQSRKG